MLSALRHISTYHSHPGVLLGIADLYPVALFSHFTESHVPTDADMNNIINFLSSTHVCGDRNAVESLHGVATHTHNACGVIPHCPPYGMAAKIPLGLQKSAPTATTRFLEREGLSPNPPGHHNSDWQLYKPSSTPSTRNPAHYGSNVSYVHTVLLVVVYLHA